MITRLQCCTVSTILEANRAEHHLDFFYPDIVCLDSCLAECVYSLLLSTILCRSTDMYISVCVHVLWGLVLCVFCKVFSNFLLSFHFTLILFLITLLILTHNNRSEHLLTQLYTAINTYSALTCIHLWITLEITNNSEWYPSLTHQTQGETDVRQIVLMKTNVAVMGLGFSFKVPFEND